jgi:hypothetical protein
MFIEDLCMVYDRNLGSLRSDGCYTDCETFEFEMIQPIQLLNERIKRSHYNLDIAFPGFTTGLQERIAASGNLQTFHIKD